MHSFLSKCVLLIFHMTCMTDSFPTVPTAWVSTIVQIANRVRRCFNILLGKMLLYKFERQQYSEVRYSQENILSSTIAQPGRIVDQQENMPLVKEIGEAILSEVHVEWKIPNFISLLSEKVDDFYSPVFSFAGEEWCLRLYWKRETDGSTKGMALSLCMLDLGGSLKTVFFTFGIKGLDGVEETEEIEYNFEEENGYGFPKFLSGLELKVRKSSLMPSNDLTITCDLRSNPHPNVVTGQENLGKSLLSMFENGEDTDIVIKVQGKEFPAHRNILRARSPVFKSMFAHDMVEKQSGVVTIEDSDADAFEDFLVYVYSGSSESITTRNVSSLYMAADKYDIYGLKEECVKFMIKNLSITFFFDVIKLAVKYDEKKLIERATNFFRNNFLKIIKTDMWQNFLEENAILGNELLSLNL